MLVLLMVSVRCIRATSFVVRRWVSCMLCKSAAICDSSSVLDSKVAVQPLTGHNEIKWCVRSLLLCFEVK
jgi:hypothetical protein